MPKVSVQIPCFNSSRYIAETLNSLFDQTFTDFEVVVINDGSTDDTEDIVMDFKDKRMKYIRQENRGLAPTRNRALAESSGKYVAFLDHDDLWMPTKLEKQVRILEDQKDTALVYTNYFRAYPNGRRRLALNGPQPAGQVFRKFLYGYPVGLSTAMIRISALDSLSGLFDESMTIYEDYDLFMRLAYRNQVSYIDEPLAVYRFHDKRATMLFKDRYVEEFEYAVEKLKDLDADFAELYHSALAYMEYHMGYLRAKIAMSKLDSSEARRCLYPYRLNGPGAFILYLSTFIPPSIWNRLQYIKNEGFLF